MRELIEREATLFDALSAPLRLMLFHVIVDNQGALNVIELRQEMSKLGCPLAQPSVSQHIKVLVHAGLIVPTKKGCYAYYKAVPGPLAEMATVCASMAKLAEIAQRETVIA